ncbi:unnamed protein product [Paramecium octaurelia]|uniref:Uncharacterized protein n=1 Tax=Paramecium octaurelia TaxID=43137 RepID=A0A8S1XQY7_PAROT|nr:unnamed protein product [Paramecium octaurelia]
MNSKGMVNYTTPVKAEICLNETGGPVVLEYYNCGIFNLGDSYITIRVKEL